MPMVARPRPWLCSGLSVSVDFLAVGRAADDARECHFPVAERHAAAQLGERRIHAVADLDDFVARLRGPARQAGEPGTVSDTMHGMYDTPMP